MSAMNHRHFENAESASDRNAILKAAEDVGLPVDEANVSETTKFDEYSCSCKNSQIF
jgi:hypothetical protein